MKRGVVKAADQARIELSVINQSVYELGPWLNSLSFAMEKRLTEMQKGLFFSLNSAIRCRVGENVLFPMLFRLFNLVQNNLMRKLLAPIIQAYFSHSIATECLRNPGMAMSRGFNPKLDKRQTLLFTGKAVSKDVAVDVLQWQNRFELFNREYKTGQSFGLALCLVRDMYAKSGKNINKTFAEMATIISHSVKQLRDITPALHLMLALYNELQVKKGKTYLKHYKKIEPVLKKHAIQDLHYAITEGYSLENIVQILCRLVTVCGQQGKGNAKKMFAIFYNKHIVPLLGVRVIAEDIRDDKPLIHLNPLHIQLGSPIDSRLSTARVLKASINSVIYRHSRDIEEIYKDRNLRRTLAFAIKNLLQNIHYNDDLLMLLRIVHCAQLDQGNEKLFQVVGVLKEYRFSGSRKYKDIFNDLNEVVSYKQFDIVQGIKHIPSDINRQICEIISQESASANLLDNKATLPYIANLVIALLNNYSDEIICSITRQLVIQARSQQINDPVIEQLSGIEQMLLLPPMLPNIEFIAKETLSELGEARSLRDQVLIAFTDNDYDSVVRIITDNAIDVNEIDAMGLRLIDYVDLTNNPGGKKIINFIVAATVGFEHVNSIYRQLAGQDKFRDKTIFKALLCQIVSKVAPIAHDKVTEFELFVVNALKPLIKKGRKRVSKKWQYSKEAVIQISHTLPGSWQQHDRSNLPPNERRFIFVQERIETIKKNIQAQVARPGLTMIPLSLNDKTDILLKLFGYLEDVAKYSAPDKEGDEFTPEQCIEIDTCQQALIHLVVSSEQWLNLTSTDIDEIMASLDQRAIQAMQKIIASYPDCEIILDAKSPMEVGIEQFESVNLQGELRDQVESYQKTMTFLCSVKALFQEDCHACSGVSETSCA